MRRTRPFLLFLALVLWVSWPLSARAQLFETKAGQAFMIDAETGTVLFSKDPDALIPPASLAKLMTMEMVFDAIRAGRLKGDDTFQISVNAWRTGGAPSRTSTMFAEVNSLVPLSELMQGAIVISANDACIAIAEGMAGTEENFALLMNERARKLGLTRSTFVNSTGLPADGQNVTVRELTMLAQHIWKAYPEFYPLYSQAEYTWNNIRQQNRNPLLKLDIGADGLKTGYTEASGFAIVGSAARDGKRLFLAMSGLASDKERAEESRRMLDWGMRAFRKVDIFAAGEVIGQAKTFGAQKSWLDLQAEGPVSILVPVTNRDRVIARIVYEGPIEAPVEAGTRIGLLKVWIGDTLAQETPLFAAESLGRGTLTQQALDAVEELAIGWLR